MSIIYFYAWHQNLQVSYPIRGNETPDHTCTRAPRVNIAYLREGDNCGNSGTKDICKPLCTHCRLIVALLCFIPRGSVYNASNSY